ncbi:MAG: tetratricopeptide repeat protein [Candidatus Omnitrophota bacterium]
MTPDTPVNKIPNYIFLLFFFIVCLALYFNALHHSFIFDDNYLIVDNQHVKYFSISKIFSNDIFYFSSKAGYDFNDKYYRPLLILSYAFEYPLWKLNPAGYRFVNIILQSLNGFLLFLIIYLIFKNKILALLSSIFFCIHPAQVCVVTFISGRSNLLETFLMLSSLAAFIYWLTSKKTAYYSFSLLFFIGALLAREGALLLPLYLFISAAFLKVDKKKIFLSLLPYLMIASVYIILRNIFMPCGKFNIAYLISLRTAGEFLLYSQSFFWQLVLPLSVKVSFLGSNFIFKLIIYLCSFLFFVYLLARAVVKKNMVIIYGLAVYSIGLLPIISLTEILKYFGPVLSEHYVYNSSIGFCLLLAYSILALHFRFPGFSKALFIAVCFYFSILTVLVNYNYKNEISFYKYVLSIDKNNIIARVNLGNAYYKNNDYDSVIREAGKTLQFKPGVWDFYFLLGNAFAAKKEFNKALESYHMALTLNPKSYLIYNNLGCVYNAQGKYSAALEAFNKADEINPESSVVLINIIKLFIRNKEYDKALATCEKLLSISPDKVKELIGIGIYWSEAGYSREGETLFKEALRLDSRAYEAMKSLAALYSNRGDFDNSIFYIKKALEVRPQDKELKESLDKLYKLKAASAK